ncbi:MAG: glycosyltransferase [Desulfobulbaceae bacterium]|jgi:rhamnosyltransferase|nr:glycosyltransferase [Desulfobulbaceae bacterium]
MDANHATVSALIPTHNAGAVFDRVLTALHRQTVQPMELIVVDSASIDDTVAIARRRGAKVISIGENDYDHAATRSRMAREARGEIVLFLTHDALLVDDQALELLVAALLRQDDIGCAYGRQLADDTATASARFLRDFNYPPDSHIRSFADRERLGFITCFCSNSFAAWRKSALEKIDFFGEAAIFGEDARAAARLLQAGFRVAYAAEARVAHSHNYTMLEEFRRSFDIGVFHARETWLLDTFGQAAGRGGGLIVTELARLLRAGKLGRFVAAMARNAAKASGYILGRRHRLLPRRLRRSFSMNRRFWR